jgi:hypothetical protein
MIILNKNPQFNYKVINFNMVKNCLLGKGNWILKMSNVKAIKFLHKKYPNISIKEIKEILMEVE